MAELARLGERRAEPLGDEEIFARPKLKSRRINNLNLKLLGKNYWSNLVESAADERPDKPVLALTRRKLSRWLSLLVIVLGAARELHISKYPILVPIRRHVPIKSHASWH